MGIKILKNIIILFLFSACNNSAIYDSSNESLMVVCETPWKQIVKNGGKVIAYEKEIAKCGEECVAIEFTCLNGNLVSTKREDIELDGNQLIDINGLSPQCHKETKCSCLLPSDKGSVSSDLIIPVYTTSQVACGQSCDTKKIEALCDNGTFVDPINKTNLTQINFSCAAAECKSCTLPWDQTQKVAHEGIATGYISSELGCGLSCSSESNSHQFKCYDGVLTKVSGLGDVDPKLLNNNCKVKSNCTCTTTDKHVFTQNTESKFKLYPANIGTCAKPCTEGNEYKCVEDQFIKIGTTVSDTTNLYKTCTDQCVFCSGLPDGSKLEEGKTVTISKSSEGTCSKACESATVTCDAATKKIIFKSGTGSLTDYKAMGCTDTCVRCDLPDGTKLEQNLQRKLYNREAADCSQTCDEATVTCDPITKSLKMVSGTGVISNYTKSSCANNCKYCSYADGSKAQQGTSTIRYFQSKVKCGETCNAAVILCNSNGVFEFLGSKPGKPEEYVTSCDVEPCKDCELPWSSSIKLGNGASTFRYEKNKATCGENCEMNKVEMKCTNSVLQIVKGNSSANLKNSYESCTSEVCASCSFNGRTLIEGERVIAYKNDGKSCAVGVCADYISRTCHNGVLDGDSKYIYGACQSSCVAPTVKTEVGRVGDSSLEGGGANPWLCPVLHSLGFATGGTKLTYYSKAFTSCGESCNNYKVTVECNNLSGLFSNSNQMLYLNCKEKCP